MDGQNKEIADSLLRDVNEYGLFPVPVGEVESWLPEVKGGTHGNKWLVTKLENMGSGGTDSPDYSSPKPGDVWDFIGDISKWLNNNERKGMEYIID